MLEVTLSLLTCGSVILMIVVAKAGEQRSGPSSDALIVLFAPFTQPYLAARTYLTLVPSCATLEAMHKRHEVC